MTTHTERAPYAEEIAAIRRILELIDAGELDATPARVWHLRGVLDALLALNQDAPERPTRSSGTRSGPEPLASDEGSDARSVVRRQ